MICPVRVSARYARPLQRLTVVPPKEYTNAVKMAESSVHRRGRWRELLGRSRLFRDGGKVAVYARDQPRQVLVLDVRASGRGKERINTIQSAVLDFGNIVYIYQKIDQEKTNI